MKCVFEGNKFIFTSDNFKCIIPTSNKYRDSFRPAKNVSEFYNGLIKGYNCEMDFDLDNSILTITHPDCERHSFGCECVKNIEFKMSYKDATLDTTIIISRELCVEAICEFLKQFRFII